MKETGIVRKVDRLGRIVLPVELRRVLKINIQDEIEICVEKENIILKKYLPHCIFCSSKENLVEYEGKNICRECVSNLSQNK